MKYQKNSTWISTPKSAIFSWKVAEMAENEEKFNLSVVAYHQTLVDPSFQLESSFFHLIVKYKKHTPWLCTAETANIS